MKRLVACMLVLVLVLGMFAGCQSNTGKQTAGPTTGAKLDAEQFLNLVMVAEPTTMDPSKGADSYSNLILNNVMEPLLRLEEDADQKNFIAAAGAESWSSNEDGSVWTFKIRKNNWSDGKAVTAYDYAYGIKRSIDQETASPYAYLLSPIKNADAVNAGEMPLDEVGVKAVDEMTLEITLTEPTPYFTELTYQRIMFPQRKDIVEQFGETYGAELTNMVYNGPFTLSTWEHNSELVLTKNEQYWDKDKVTLQTVNYKIIEDENARYNSLENGSVDVLIANKPEWRDKFIANDKMKHLMVTNTSTFFMFFNTKDELFKNANIRKAFSIAVDRAELADVIYYGVNEPAFGWVSPSIAVGSDEYRTVVTGPIEQLIKDNPDPKAVLIEGLKELGLDPDPSKLTVKLSLGATNQWFKTYGEYLQQMYMKNLGINFELEMVEWPVFSDKVDKGEFQMGYMGWGAEFNDPISLLSLLKSTSSAIGTGWANARYDELIDLAAVEMDPKKRLELYKEAEHILLYDEAVLAPTVYPRSNVFQYTYVNNLGITPFETAGCKYGYTDGRP